MSGFWYFISTSKEEAIKIAKKFQREYNKNKNDNYTVEFEAKPKEFEIKEGYIPLNRS